MEYKYHDGLNIIYLCPKCKRYNCAPIGSDVPECSNGCSKVTNEMDQKKFWKDYSKEKKRGVLKYIINRLLELEKHMDSHQHKESAVYPECFLKKLELTCTVIFKIFCMSLALILMFAFAKVMIVGLP